MDKNELRDQMRWVMHYAGIGYPSVNKLIGALIMSGGIVQGMSHRDILGVKRTTASADTTGYAVYLPSSQEGKDRQIVLSRTFAFVSDKLVEAKDWAESDDDDDEDE